MWVTNGNIFCPIYVGQAPKWCPVPDGKSRDTFKSKVNNRDTCNSIPILGPGKWTPLLDIYPPMWLKQTPGSDVCAYASIASALYFLETMKLPTD